MFTSKTICKIITYSTHYKSRYFSYALDCAMPLNPSEYIREIY